MSNKYILFSANIFSKTSITSSDKFSVHGLATHGIDILTSSKFYRQIEEEVHSIVNARFVCAGQFNNADRGS